MRRRRFLAIAGSGALAAFAGCTARGLTREEAIERSGVIAAIDVGREAVTVSLVAQPTVEEETCWWNPATKTSMCNSDTIEAEIDAARLVWPDSEVTIEKAREQYVFDQAPIVTGRYEGGLHAADMGWTSFGFEVDGSGVVPDSYFVDEEF